MLFFFNYKEAQILALEHAILNLIQLELQAQLYMKLFKIRGYNFQHYYNFYTTIFIKIKKNIRVFKIVKKIMEIK